MECNIWKVFNYSWQGLSSWKKAPQGMVLFPHPAANRMWNWAEQEYLLFIHSYLILWSVSRFGTPRGFPRAEQAVDPSWHIEVRFPQGFLSVFSVFLVLVKWWFIWCFCGLSNRSKWRPFLTPGPSSEATESHPLFIPPQCGWLGCPL